MDARDWDALAGDFDRDVFDPTGTDGHGDFARALRRVGRVELAVDLGCGTGRLLPRLARRATHVVGLDFAPALLRAAAARTAGSDRIAVRRADLARPLRKPRGAGLVACTNVLLSPDDGVRHRILRNARNMLRPRGELVLVVPALESALWLNNRIVAWNERAGLRGARALRGGIASDRATARDLLRGVVDQGGVRTKHFLREELHEVLRGTGFAPEETGRVVYPWDAYLERPPRWLGEAGPWDWVVRATRA